MKSSGIKRLTWRSPIWFLVTILVTVMATATLKATVMLMATVTAMVTAMALATLALATLPVATLTIATVTVATDKDPTDKPGTMAALTDLRWLTMMLTAPTTTDVLTRVTKSKLFQTTTEHDMVDAIIY